MPSTDAPIKASAPTDPGGSSASGAWFIQPLQGWHFPHLQDPCFQPLLPLLQRSLLLALPDRVLSSLDAPGPRRHRVLVATRSGPSGPVIGLIVTRPHNRRRTCWQICHLRLATDDLNSVSRLDLAAALVRQAISGTRTAASWVARSSGIDLTRLAALRDAGFQPQLRQLLWRWQSPARPGDAVTGAAASAEGLQLMALHPRLYPLLWHLEQATTPAPLRQLLDRRIDDLRGSGPGLLLVDTSRDQAVVSLRHSGDHPGGGSELELRVHPARSDLHGSVLTDLLSQLQLPGPYWLRTEQSDAGLGHWLETIGAQAQGEEVLMARSVWRRQPLRPMRSPVRRLEAVIQQLQPGRRPLPTPSSTP